MLQTIPLSQLKPSSRNVRKKAGGIADMAASIAAHGLRQNLTVIPRDDGYEVSAGGRRFRALQLLEKEGRLPAALADGIPCMLTTDEAAAEVSLAENVVREAMHPADEFDAFKALADDGKTSDEIAERFGCAPRHVEQRLRLARVAPEILDDYRAGKANLEQMQALALTDDNTAQRAAWAAGKTAGYMREPHRIRDAITSKEVDGDSALGKYVGVKTYEAAGGIPRKDLFSEEIFFPDHLLLEKLALEKLQKTVDKVLKEGWKWGEARLTLSWGDRQKFGQAPSDRKGTQTVYTADVMAKAGIIVHIGFNGQAEVERGLVRPEDRKEAAKTAGGEDNIKGGKTAKPAKKPGELSFASVQRLQAEVTAEIQRTIVGDPNLALALLVAELAYTSLCPGFAGESRRWVFISRDHAGRAHGPHREIAKNTPAGKAMAAAETGWRKKLPTTLPKIREWALAQERTNPQVLMNLLAFLVGRETECVDATPGQPSGITTLASAIDADLTEYWKPTEEWLATLPKSTILEIVRESGKGGKTTAVKLAKLGKAELPKAALTALPKNWLPKPLAPPKAKAKLDGKQKASGEREDDDVEG